MADIIDPRLCKINYRIPSINCQVQILPLSYPDRDTWDSRVFIKSRDDRKEEVIGNLIFR